MPAFEGSWTYRSYVNNPDQKISIRRTQSSVRLSGPNRIQAAKRPQASWPLGLPFAPKPRCATLHFWHQQCYFATQTRGFRRS